MYSALLFIFVNMLQTCRVSDEKFQIDESEIAFLEKMNLPLPVISTKSRDIMRMAFRNDRNLYKRKCDLSGKQIISVYHQESPYKVYDVDIWKSFNWTPPYLDYDPSKDFFQQYAELQRITPRVSLFSVYNENCDFLNAGEKNKNCYMVFVTDRCQDSFYLDTSYNSTDCADCSYCYDCQLCYQSCDLKNCYFAKYSYLCENCSNISFCFDLKGCSDCFLCFGLRNQKYCILNNQLSKAEYEKRIAELDFTSQKTIEVLVKRFEEEIMPNSYSKIINCENSTGNFLINCHNCQDCYTLESAQDCRRVRSGANGLRDVYDTYAVVDGSELIYNNVSTTESYNCHNVIGCWTCKSCAYGEYLQACQDCFGCISLKKKRYCILNKQYSKAEYERIKADIISKMGDYYGSNFPIALAPFSYQDSAYKDYLSLKKEEVEKIGWRWQDNEVITDIPQNAEKSLNLPDRVDDFDTNECQRVFLCEISGKPYKIVEQELKLLKRLRVPLPSKQHDIRFRERISFRKAN